MRSEIFPETDDKKCLFETSNSYDEINEKNRLLGWNAQYRQLKPLEYAGRMTGLELNGTTALIEDVDVPSEVVGEFQGGDVWIMLCFSPADEPIHALGNHFSARSAFLLDQGGEVDVITGSEARFAHFCINADEFLSAWEMLAPGIEPFQYGYYGFVDVPQNCSRACYRDVSRMLKGEYTRAANSEEYVPSLLAMLALHASSENPIHDRRPRAALHTQIRARAREYIESSLNDAIRLPELCDYAGTSISTLTRVFREFYGLSPAAYIRWCRMYHCHEFLKRSDPADQSVGDIIRACGIKHPGRFATEYRRYFGEFPKQTLGYRPS